MTPATAGVIGEATAGSGAVVLGRRLYLRCSNGPCPAKATLADATTSTDSLPNSTHNEMTLPY